MSARPRRRLILWVLVLLSAHLLSAQTASVPKPIQNFRISGTIVNLVDGQPVAGAEVIITSTQRRDETKQVLTAADGRFAFDHVLPGKYSLAAHRQGYVAQAYQQHDQYSTAVAVGPGLISEDLTFPLTPDGSISGTVFDEENELVRAGEAILFTRTTGTGANGFHLQARGPLDEQGRYHFGHLGPGTYLVAVSAQPWYAQDPQASPQEAVSFSPDGQSNSHVALDSSERPDSQAPAPLDVTYPTTYYPNVTDSENAAPIQLHPGERATADVNLRAVPALHLRIRNASSDPTRPLTAFVEQRLLDTPIQVQARSQQINSGVIALTGIPPGHFTLSIRNFTGKEWISLNKEVDVASDTEIDAAENSVGTVSVKGVVRLQGNTPLPAGAFVRFSNRQSGETFGAQVSGKGEFDVQTTVTAQSDYSVAVFNVPRFIVQSISANGARVIGHTVSLPRGGVVQLDVTMSEGLARVNGTVLRDDKPASESMVLLVPEHFENDVTLFRRDQSDSDGTFSLYEVLPGRYIAIAIEKGWELEWQDPVILKPYLERGETVEVTANKTYKISLKLQPQAVTAAPTTSAIQ